MSEVLVAPVLVLNRNYQPVRVVTVRHAFTMMYVGRARALDVDFEPRDFQAWSAMVPAPHDDAVRTPSGVVRVPRVLLLARYGRVPETVLRLSRRNLFLRDDHTCQYCRRKLAPRELNLDHVVPRSRGGPSTWENLVTACRDCNLRKGHRTPDECGMPLARRPAPPPWSAVVQMVATARRFAEWEPFLPRLEGLDSGERESAA